MTRNSPGNTGAEFRRARILRNARSELEREGSVRTGTVRIDIRHSGNLKFSATCWDESELKFEVEVDEPSMRGGDNSAPAPLSYFILGAATCFLTQIQKLIIIDGLRVKILGCTVRAHFDYVRSGVFREVIYDLKLVGQEKPSVVRNLANAADSFCYASNTLKPSVSLLVSVNYNGAALP